MINIPGIPQKQFEPNARCPLDGIRVLDLSRVVAGNMVSLLLADFGAEVIKIETPEGDALRDWLVGGVAANWKVYARNKKSVCLNLRKAAAKDLLLKMVESAQVFIENFRPGTLEKMGLGPEVLHEKNPQLVIVRVTGLAHWPKACRALPRSMVLPTVSQCCRPTSWRTARRAHTARSR